MIKAESKFIRTSPRKIRLVADLVRNMSLTEAVNTLTYLRKRAAKPLLKTIKQAIANAVNNLNLNKDSLEIQSIEVNEGATYKRWNPVSRGRAHSIFKRTSHIKVILKSNKPKKTIKPKEKK
ncbi:MAG: 50S ribosomal protein L22 [Patescibacteria group bacterium]|nr:50S ribosomal protein L22 [Patescibacteria group bacterium]